MAHRLGSSDSSAWSRPSQLGVVILLSAGMAVGGGAALAYVSLSTGVLLATAIGGVLLFPLARRAWTGRFDLFEPLVVFAIAYGMMFVVRPLVVLAEHDFLYVRSFRTVDVQPSFNHMLVLALAGAAAFQLGYATSLGSRLGRRFRQPSERLDRMAVRTALGIAMIGVLGFVAFLVSGGGFGALKLVLAGRGSELNQLIQDTSNYLWQAPWLLVPSILLLVAVGQAERQPTLYAYAAILSVFLVVIEGAVGHRIVLLPLFAAMLVYRYLVADKRPNLASLVSITVAAFMLSTLFLSVRDASNREVNGGVAESANRVLAHPAAGAGALFHGGDTEMALAFAAALQAVPAEVHYQHGRATVGDALLRPIPRQLWPGKPLTAREQLVRAVWPRDFAAGVANIEFSVPFHFYLDFGAVGVVLGMALYGLLARALWVYYQLHSDAPGARLLLALGLPFLVLALRDSPADSLVRAAFLVWPLLFALHLSATRSAAVRA